MAAFAMRLPLEARKTLLLAHVDALDPGLRERLAEHDLTESVRLATVIEDNAQLRCVHGAIAPIPTADESPPAAAVHGGWSRRAAIPAESSQLNRGS
jgi:hypothetical protein